MDKPKLSENPQQNIDVKKVEQENSIYDQLEEMVPSKRYLYKTDRRLLNIVWCMIFDDFNPGHFTHHPDLVNLNYEIKNSIDPAAIYTAIKYNGQIRNINVEQQKNALRRLLYENWINKDASIRCLNLLNALNINKGRYCADINFLKNDENSSAWAHRYFMGINNKFHRIYNPEISLNPIEFIQLQFDLLGNSEYAEMLLFKMRKAYHQKKFRDTNKDRKQYSLLLNVETKEKIKQLSQINRLNQGEVIDQLVTYALDHKIDLRWNTIAEKHF